MFINNSQSVTTGYVGYKDRSVWSFCVDKIDLIYTRGTPVPETNKISGEVRLTDFVTDRTFPTSYLQTNVST